MRDGDRVRIVFFDTRYDVYDFTATNASERDQLLSYAYNYLLSQYVYGGYGSYITAYSGALASIEMADDIGNGRMVYVLTEDSDILKTSSTIPTIQSYKDQGDFETGIVMMKQANTSGFNFAKQIADGIGGDYYQYPLYSSLWFYFYNQYGSFFVDGDSDGDGISDMDEVCGILKPNSRIVRTDPNLKDTDGDTLDEMDELKKLYPVEDLNFASRITADSSLKATIVAAEMTNDPTNPDSDGDGYLDNEDANPDKNPDMVYLFCNPDFFDPALKRAQLYRDSGLSVIFARFSDVDSFETVWDGIGLYGAYNPNGYKIYGDKYYYNAKYVVICSHGNNESICLGSNNDSVCEKLYAYDFAPRNGFETSDLSDKKIDSLNIYACSCGKKTKGSEKIILAQDFVEKKLNIKQVIAADAVLWGRGNKYYFESYDYVEKYPETDYAVLKTMVLSGNISDRYHYYDSIFGVEEEYGFAIYTRECEPIDYFSDDVFYGTLYITEDNLSSYGNGIIYFSYDITNQIGNSYHDPVLD